MRHLTSPLDIERPSDRSKAGWGRLFIVIPAQAGIQKGVQNCHSRASGNPGFLPGFLLTREWHVSPLTRPAQQAGLSRGGQRRTGLRLGQAV